MSSINGVGGNLPAQNIQKTSAPVAPATTTPTSTPTRGADKLELSGVSHLLKSLKANDIRADKVASIKSQIADGSYEDDHKLNVATDRLLNDLLK